MRNDLIPEEGEQEYTQLLTMLRSASQGRVPITSREQEQIIARVRERLASTTSSSLSTSSSTSTPDVGTFPPRYQFVPHLSRRHARTSTRLVTNLAAALVLIALILGSLALFRAYPLSHLHGTTASTVASRRNPVAQAQSHGLQASLHVLIGGPYFLGELLPIDVSFTNHTQKPVWLDGSVRIPNNGTANACYPSELLAQLTQGSNPTTTIPQLDFACAQPYILTEVKPGQTITIHQYVPLIKSGDVSLIRGILFPNRSGDPLDRLWPDVHLQLQVNPKAPKNRAISLRNQQGQVLINAPAGARAHLLYMQEITCDGHDLANPGQWTPLTTTVLHEPSCPTAHRHWTFIVSAPGYEIAYGKQAG
jgi:hypothetical protein